MDCTIGGSNPEGEEIFSFSKKSRSHSAFLFNGIALLSWGREAGAQSSPYTPLDRAEIKNEWPYTSTPPVYLHCVDKDFNFWHLIRQEKPR